MFENILDYLFGCWHRNYSFPITAKAGKRHSEAAKVTGTYVVCLECGKEFPYDWREMRVVTMPRSKAAAPSIAETADEPLARSA
jgi:hypothetical protein